MAPVSNFYSELRPQPLTIHSPVDPDSITARMRLLALHPQDLGNNPYDTPVLTGDGPDEEPTLFVMDDFSSDSSDSKETASKWTPLEIPTSLRMPASPPTPLASLDLQAQTRPSSWITAVKAAAVHQKQGHPSPAASALPKISHKKVLRNPLTVQPRTQLEEEFISPLPPSPHQGTILDFMKLLRAEASNKS